MVHDRVPVECFAMDHLVWAFPEADNCPFCIQSPASYQCKLFKHGDVCVNVPVIFGVLVYL